MRNAVRRSIPIASLCRVDSCGVGAGLRMRNPAAPAAASATMKNRCPVRAARRILKARATQPARGGRTAPRGRKSGGGGGSNFDGAWIVSGVGVTCQGTSSNAVVVTSGKIIGQTARGTVSPDGRVYGTSTGNGITVITTGRLSGRSGGGTFRQSDGCTGRWTASKQ